MKVIINRETKDCGICIILMKNSHSNLNNFNSLEVHSIASCIFFSSSSHHKQLVLIFLYTLLLHCLQNFVIFDHTNDHWKRWIDPRLTTSLCICNYNLDRISMSHDDARQYKNFIPCEIQLHPSLIHV